MLQYMDREKKTWAETFPSNTQQSALTDLENGGVIFFPKLAFPLSEKESSFLNPYYADQQAKNISYHSLQQRLWGVRNLNDAQHDEVKSMLQRFSNCALGLIQQLFPSYAPHLKIGRTSFRPVEIYGRKTSYRKDDKRLHVDAFPSAPNQGERILRVFCNINPHQQDRIWRLGEPFEQVAERFIPLIQSPFPGTRRLLRLLKITKSYRSLYDHYMLHIHDRMKEDETYQTKVSQQTVAFPSGSTWIVQTDHVSHAAMAGQHLLEQTFSLPVHAMQDPSRAPLKILEKILNRKLI